MWLLFEIKDLEHPGEELQVLFQSEGHLVPADGADGLVDTWLINGGRREKDIKDEDIVRKKITSKVMLGFI